MRVTAAVTLGLLCCRGAVLAQVVPTGGRWIEAGGFHHRVSNDFGHWTGGYARAVLGGRRDVWYLDARAQKAFGDGGAYGSLANVHTFGSRIYTQLGVGGGTGDFVFPELRVDAALAIKLGAARSVVVTVGGTLVRAKTNHRDRAVSAALTWYAARGVMAELGGRINWSDPNAVRSERANGALTLGTHGRRIVTLRGSAGTEGYQLTGTAATLRRFKSQEVGLSWREWAGRRWGFVLGGEFYDNPFYTRAGLSLSLFRDW